MEVVAAAGLLLGLRRRPRHPHGLAPHRPARGAACRAIGDPERLSVIRNLLRAARDGRATSTWCWSSTTRDRAASTSPTSSASSRRRPPPSTSRTPSYLGMIETSGAEIARARPRKRARETIVGVDPDLARHPRRRPRDYGADIVVGPTQPLGVHMNCGGGVGGFIATRDEERYVREYQRLPRLASPRRAAPGEYGFGARLVAPDLLRHARGRQGLDRQLGLSLGHRRTPSTWRCSGREGFRELGELIIARAHYAARRLGEIKGVTRPLRRRLLQGVRRQLRRHRQARVAEINERLREQRRSSAARTSRPSCPSSASRALYCVTEIHTAADIDRLAGGAEGGRCMSDARAARLPRRRSGTSRVVMEMGAPGRRGAALPAARAGGRAARRPGRRPRARRPCAAADAPALPELTEPEVQRHYLQLSQQTLGMMGISLFGTCTMKYNPRVSEEAARRRAGRGASRCSPTTRCRACSRSSTTST